MTDEERQARIHHHMYETCEGIAEHAERIVALEELCAELYMNLRNREVIMELMGIPPSKEQRDGDEIIERRMDELGVPHE